MSELTDIIEAFGAVDDAVVANPALTPKVARVLPAYAHGAAGWYRASLNWMGALRAAQDPAHCLPGHRVDVAAFEGVDLCDEARGIFDAGEAPAVPPPPKSLTQTLTQLANTRSPEDNDLAPHRLLAMTALARVIDTEGDPLAACSPDDLVPALVPLQRRAGESISDRNIDPDEQDRAVSLLAHLADERRYPTAGHLRLMVTDAQVAGFLPPTTPPAVAARWAVTRSPTAPGPAVSFSTHHRLHGVAVGAVQAILDQTSWSTYKPPWCFMQDMGQVTGRTFQMAGPSARYLELVADDCDLASSLYAFQTCLDFHRVDTPDGAAILGYRRSPDQKKNGGDGAVSVDEGSLVVRQAGSAVDVITTKRVQFAALAGTPPLVAGMLAHFVWVLGYPSMAEFFVHRLMQGNPDAEVETLHDSGDPSAGGDPDGPSTLTVDAVLKEAMAECRHSARLSVDKLASGHYAVDDLATDVGKVVTHGRRHTKAVASLWTSALFGGETPGQGTGSPAGPGPGDAG
jgi:hypothetical protein